MKKSPGRCFVFFSALGTSMYMSFVVTQGTYKTKNANIIFDFNTEDDNRHFTRMENIPIHERRLESIHNDTGVDNILNDIIYVKKEQKKEHKTHVSDKAASYQRG